MTDVGVRRDENQDHFLVADLNKAMRVRQSSLELADGTSIYGEVHGELILVADGMGGAAEGELASRTTVATLAEYMLNSMPWFFSLEGSHDADFEAELQRAVDGCQQRMHQIAETAPQAAGMGTTLTCGYVVWPRLYLAHVGDSRAYLLRGQRLDCLTTDHTMAQQLGLDQLWDHVKLSKSKLSHTLWNCLSTKDSSAEPDLRRVLLQPGDALLFCTDGLGRHVEDAEIVQVLLRHGDAVAEPVRELMQLAKSRGGRDNITIVYGRFPGSQSNNPTAPLAEAESLTETVVDVDLRGM